MANPQPTDAHLRIAHEITEAIMLRDFTKRQRKILDLILRLSWGCGKKTAIIPRQSDFTVIGIYEPDVKNELNWLIESKVIVQDNIEFYFNKDYDQWQVSRVKPYEPEKLSILLRINLNGVSKTLSYTNRKLSKTLSKKLVKHEVRSSQNTNFFTSKLASSKENINKIKENNSIYNKHIKNNKKNYNENVATTKEDIARIKAKRNE